MMMDSEKTTPLISSNARQRQLPVATITIIVITAIVTTLQIFYPELLPALDRNLDALRAGQWWRLITPRFVQPDIWPQYILLAILALVGPPVERRFGSWRWLALWLVGGLTGELVSFAWQPQGAGASVGIFGLIGAWLVLLLQHEDAGPWPVAAAVFAFMTSLIVLAVSTPVVAATAAAIVAGLFVQLGLHPAQWRRLAPYLGVAGLVGGLLLTGLRDQHGPPLLGGALVAALFLAVEARGKREHRGSTTIPQG
jgi:membrane associated rhomboid family serine protease